MVDPISSTSVAPRVIRFKPDPGEPAVDVTASPRQTAYLVTAQEQRNETRLRNRVISRGEDILYSYRTFDQTYQDGSVVYTGGLTTVVSREHQASPLRGSWTEPQEPGQENNEIGARRDDEESEKPSPAEQTAMQATEESERDLEEDKRELGIQRGRVENRKEHAEAQLEQAAEDRNALQVQVAERKVSELERREDAIEREERKVELERLQERLERTQDVIGSAVMKNLGTASKILGVPHGREPDSTPSVGRRLDLWV